MGKACATAYEMTFWQLVRMGRNCSSLQQMEATQVYTGHQGPVYCIHPGPETDSFYTGGSDGKVVKWQLNSNDGLVVAAVGQAIFSIKPVSKNLFMIGTEGGDIHVIDIESREEIKLFKVHEKGIFSFAELRAGWIVASGGDGTISIWDPSTLSLIRQIPIADGKIRHLSLSKEGTLIALASTDGTVRILDTELFNEMHTIQAHRQGANCVIWLPNKPIIITGGRDGHLKAWHTDENYRLVLSIPSHEQTVYRLALSNNDLIASASRDKSAKLWRASDMEMVQKLIHSSKDHTRSVNDLMWSGHILLTVSDDSVVRRFDPI